MPRKSPRIKNDPDIAWVETSYEVLVRRFFKSVNKYSESIQGIMPGRYWNRWTIPGDCTSFDYEVSKLLSNKGKFHFRDRSDLEAEGTICPFYTWRVHAIWALIYATKTEKIVSQDNIDHLIAEKCVWNNRIAQARILLSAPDITDNIITSAHFQPSEFDFDAMPFHRSEMELRANRILELKNEIEKDTKIAAIVDRQLKRVEKELAKIPSGTARDQIWKRSFYMYMANVWRHTTGENPSAGDGPFANILSAAVQVGGGAESDPNKAPKIQKWGQHKSLIPAFAKMPSGQGFRLGETGTLSLENDTVIAARGDEIKSMISRHGRDKETQKGLFHLLEAALMMRDSHEMPAAVVVQYVVIRHILMIGGYWSDSLGVELGWLDKDRHSIEMAIGKTIQLCVAGDMAALIVLRAACTFNPQAKTYILSRTHRSPLLGADLRDILDSIANSPAENRGLVDADGGHQAFKAAVSLLGAYVPGPGLEMTH